MSGLAHYAVAVLLNSLWEAPLIALLTWLCLRAAPNSTASTRYITWFIALLAACVLPFLTANVQVASAPKTTIQAPVQTPLRHPSQAVSKHSTVTNVAQTSSQPAQTAAPSFEHFQFTLPRIIATGVAAAWAIGAALLLLRLLLELVHLEGFKRDALPLPFEYRDTLSRWAEAAGYGRDTRVCVSPHTDVPVAIGLFDAMILLPQPLLDALSPTEIEHIALHELAHLRRHDDWSNALERVLVTLFFFNPAVRWIASQIDVEREVACDDHVVELTHEVRPYAYCLTKMAQITQWPRAALAAPGVFVTRKSISIRIERLLRATTSGRIAISYATALSALAAVVLVFAGAHFFGPVIAAPLNAPVAAASAKPLVKTVHIAQKQAPAKAIVAATEQPVAATQQAVPATQPSVITRTNTVYVRVTATPSLIGLSTPKATLQTHAVAPPLPPANVVAQSGLRCDGCNLGGVDWHGRDLRGAILRGANLDGADLRNADLRNADLSGANLHNVRLAGANLQGANLTGTNLDGTSLRGVDLSGASIAGANISVAELDGADVRTLLDKCMGCNFSGLNARGQNLSGLRISGINLSSVDFRRANLRNTVFEGVNLSNAQFQGAQLSGAVFSGCSLSGVDFHGVDLTGVHFAGSDLTHVIMP